MGWQSYALAYDTDAQLEKLLEICKLHNAWGGRPTNKFFRYHKRAAFEQIQTGEELVGPVVAKMKNPYKTARNGPALQNVLLVGNGGGRWSTFKFFDCHCRRAFPSEWPRIAAYEFHQALGKRMAEKQPLPEERLQGGPAIFDPADVYSVRLALEVTQRITVDLVRAGEMTGAEAAAAGCFVFETVEAGYVVDATRFSAEDRAAADAFSAQKTPRKSSGPQRRSGAAPSARRSTTGTGPTN